MTRAGDKRSESCNSPARGVRLAPAEQAAAQRRPTSDEPNQRPATACRSEAFLMRSFPTARGRFATNAVSGGCTQPGSAAPTISTPVFCTKSESKRSETPNGRRPDHRTRNPTVSEQPFWYIGSRFVMRLKTMPPSCTLSTRRSSPAAVARRLGLRSASELFSSILPGDEIRSFKNSGLHWKIRIGRRGYALVRNGQVVEAVSTLMN